MNRTQRIAASATVGLLLFAGASLVAGSASDEEVQSLALPAVTPGTKAVYDIEAVRYDNRWQAVPYTPTSFEVQWRADEALGATGHVHGAATLAVRVPYHFPQYSYSSDVFSDQSFDPATGDALRIRVWENFPNEGDQVWAQYDSWSQYQPVCGFWTPFHGQSLELDAPVAVTGRCHDGEDLAPAMFRYDGLDTVDDMDALRFQHTSDPEVRLWYNPGLQVPVKVRAHLDDLMDPAKTQGHVFELTLRSYALGDGAFPSASRDAGLPMVAPQPAPDGRPNEDGFGAAFTLDDAIAAAKADDESPRVVHWMGRFPDMYLAYVQMQTDETAQGLKDHVYFLLWTDGSSWIGKRVENSVQGPLGAIETESSTHVGPWTPAWLRSGLAVPADIHPSPTQRVPGLPAIQDVMELWQAHTGKADVPDAYGFGHWCEGDCDTAAFAVVYTGQFMDGKPTGSVSINGFTAIPTPDDQRDNLYVDHQGNLFSHVQRIDQRPDHALLDVGQAEPPAAEGHAAVVADDASLWALPSSTFFLAAGASAVVAGWLVYLRGGALFGLFSRITQSSVLRNPQRSVVHDLVQNEPGIHFQELVRRTGYGAGAVNHHLGKLLDTALVQTVESGGYTCYFPAGTTDHRVMKAQGALKADAARRILARIQSDGASTPRALAASLAISPGTVSHHLRRLREAGLVEGGGRTPYTATEIASAALAA